MSAPTTPQRPTTQITMQGIENAVTPLRNRLFLTPTRSTLKKRYDPFQDLRTLADLFQLGAQPDLDPALESFAITDTSLPEENFNVQSFTTRNLSGFRLSGSSTVEPMEDTSFDTSRRMRLSMSSLPNTSNIAIPEAIYHQNSENESDPELSMNHALSELEEFEIPDFSIPEANLVPPTGTAHGTYKTPAFNEASIKKLMSSLGNWSFSPDVIKTIIGTSQEFVAQEVHDLAHMATAEGYSTVDVANVLDLVSHVELPFDLFGDKSQNEILDLAIKLFDLEDARALNSILWPSKRRRPRKILETIPDLEHSQGEGFSRGSNDGSGRSSHGSLAGSIEQDQQHQDDRTVNLETLATEINIGIAPDSSLDNEDFDIPMAEEEEEE